jgi:hypothetical protein
MKVKRKQQRRPTGRGRKVKNARKIGVPQGATFGPVLFRLKSKKENKPLLSPGVTLMGG